MKIIGHRGAAGLAPENTLKGIEAAVRAGADAIELDVRLTSDNKPVLHHDISTGRTGSTDVVISKTTLKDLQKVKLQSGEPIPTLQAAVQTAGATPLFIEAKGSNWADSLAEFINKSREQGVSVIAFNHDELSRFHELCPGVPVYALEHWNPMQTFNFAKSHNFTGINVHFWKLDPLLYWLARRAGLEVIVYTVNKSWIARFLKRLYPDISITTNYPDKLRSIK